MNGLGNTASPHREHFREQALGALGCVAAQVALTDLGSHQLARTGYAESLRSSFMRLDFVLSISFLAWHSRSPLTQNSAGFPQLRGCQQKPTTKRTTALRVYFFFAILLGARTISIVRPSSAGACSTIATSERDSATSFRSSSAISG